MFIFAVESPLDQFEIRNLVSLHAPILGNLYLSVTNIGLYLVLGGIIVLINNLIEMIPYSFASTSHFVLTFSVSFSIVLGATILGFQKHGLKFFSLFVPSGCPLALLPLLVLIGFISYLARNVSLGLRLAANILSGHMLLNILSGFTYNIMTSGIVFFFLGLLPLAFILAFITIHLNLKVI